MRRSELFREHNGADYAGIGNRSGERLTASVPTLIEVKANE
jgi:hypothetical protein